IRSNVRPILKCSLMDVTEDVPVPPPSIGMSISPNFLTLSTGIEKTIQVHAKSLANFPSTVTFSPPSLKGINLNFYPTELHLPAYGSGTSTLHVLVPDVAYGNGTTVMDIMSSDRYIRNRFNGSNEIILPVKGYASVSAALLDVSKGLPFRSNLSAAIPL